jgi:hypothetical protein
MIKALLAAKNLAPTPDIFDIFGVLGPQGCDQQSKGHESECFHPDPLNRS